jgi:hypothetical protein
MPVFLTDAPMLVIVNVPATLLVGAQVPMTGVMKFPVLVLEKKLNDVGVPAWPNVPPV